MNRHCSLLFACWCLLLVVSPAPVALAQTNPCADIGPTQLVVNPTYVVFQSPDHAATLSGVNKIASYEWRATLQGQTTVAWTASIPRGNVSVAFQHPTDPTQTCYKALIAFQVQTDQPYVGVLVAKPDTSLGLQEAASGSSNPFVSPSPLRAPTAARAGKS